MSENQEDDHIFTKSRRNIMALWPSVVTFNLQLSAQFRERKDLPKVDHHSVPFYEEFSHFLIIQTGTCKIVGSITPNKYEWVGAFEDRLSSDNISSDSISADRLNGVSRKVNTCSIDIDKSMTVENVSKWLSMLLPGRYLQLSHIGRINNIDKKYNTNTTYEIEGNPLLADSDTELFDCIGNMSVDDSVLLLDDIAIDRSVSFNTKNHNI